jgi:hypothetical protein
MTTFTPLTVFLTKPFTANEIYLHGARSGFERESPVTLRWFGVTASQLDNEYANITSNCPCRSQ